MKAMKAMKVGQKPLSKGALTQALSDATEIKRKDCTHVLETLAEVATKQVKSVGKFVLPGLCMIKTRHKPATKAGKRLVFSEEVMAKAKPAKTVVKAFPVAALKKQI